MEESNREEENNNESNSSSWWGAWPSWLQSAKEKSSTALEFMKRDLTEFSQVVQTDAVAAVSSTAAMLKEKLTVDNAEAVADKARQSITSVIGTIAEVFVPQKELEDSELMIIKNSEPVIMDWWQSQLYLIQKDPKTFCHEPEGPPEMYENWLESFDLNDHQEEMTDIMMSSLEVRNIYDKLVPSAVSHLEFWQRYYYRVHLLKKADAKRAQLMKQAEQISIEDIQWDKDNDLNSGDSISPSNRHNTGENTSSFDKNSHIKSENITNSELIDNQPVCNSESTPPQTITDTTANPETVNSAKQGNLPETATPGSNANATGSKLESNLSSSSDALSEPSSADSTDGSRSSPIESLGKG